MPPVLKTIFIFQSWTPNRRIAITHIVLSLKQVVTLLKKLHREYTTLKSKRAAPHGFNQDALQLLCNNRSKK